MKKIVLPLCLLTFSACSFTACLETNSIQAKPVAIATPVACAKPVCSPCEGPKKSISVPVSKTKPIYKSVASAKSVIEPSIREWDHNSAGRVNRPYVYTPPRRIAAAEGLVAEVDSQSGPMSGMKIVSTEEVRNRLRPLGIDFSDNALPLASGVQLDEIQVTLDEPPTRDVVLVEAKESNQLIEANGRDVVVISTTSKITISGECGQLLIAGEKNVVTTDSVKSVQVYGDSNHLTLGDIKAGELHGNYNLVDWKRPGVKPSIISNGVANEVAEPRR